MCLGRHPNAIVEKVVRSGLDGELIIVPGTTDAELLRQYAREDSQAAFAELVRRHADWVRASAARQVRDPHLADDVTQAAFIVLAKKAASLHGRENLSPWLFGVLRLVAKRALRDEARRRRHEQAAAAERTMSTSTSAGDEALTADEWARVATVLDESVSRLRAADRDAVLLRFYQRSSLAEVAAALGDISEDAARKRLDRAVERLRRRLAARGVDVTIRSLMPAMLAWTTPPPAVAPAIPTPANAAARPLELAKGAITMARISALKVPMACAAATAVVVGFAMFNRASAPQRAPVVATSAPAAPAASASAPVAAAPAPPQPQQQQKSILDKEVAGIRVDNPLPADVVIDLLQDMASVTVSVDWEKLAPAVTRA